MKTNGLVLSIIPARKAAVFAAVFALGLFSCKSPVDLDSSYASSSNPDACAVSISITAPASIERTVVPSVSTQIAAISISLVDSKGSVFTASSTTGNASIMDIYPGLCAISVRAYSDTAYSNLLATGTKTVTAIAGRTIAASVDLTLSNQVAGTGNFRLPISFPANLGITSLSAAFADGSAAALVTDADYSAGIATLTAQSVPSGPHIIAISFNAGTSIVGRVYESINIRTGLISNRWVDGGGNLLTTRVFTADELFTSTRSLASLTVAGVSVPLVSGTTAYSIGVGALDSLTFAASAGLPSQSLAYSWNAGDATTATGSIASDSFSPALSTIGVNTLKITVTAADRQSTLDYTITITRKWTVSFNLKGGGTMAPVTVENGQTVAAPATPTYAGFTFEGWYADAAYATTFTFGSGGTAIMANSTIYAKWTESGIIRVSVTLSPGSYQTVSTAGKASVQQGKTLVLAVSGTIPANATSWAWYFDGTAITPTATNGADTPTLSLAATATTSVGEHTVTCAAINDGITYSGTVIATVTAFFTVSYDGNGNTSGRAPSAQTFTGGTAVILAATDADFAKSGYSFAGWVTSAADGSHTYAKDATTGTLTANLRLYAVWANIKPSPVTMINAIAGDQKVKISWLDPSASNNGDLSYIRINYDNGTTTGTTTVSTGVLTCVIKGLTNGTNYTFTVQAVDFDGEASAPVTILAQPHL